MIGSLGDNGAVRSTLNLVEGLLNKGFQVDIVVTTPEGVNTKLIPPESRLIVLQGKRKGFCQSLVWFFSLVKYLRKHRPIALICADGINYPSFAKITARVNTKIILTSRNNLLHYYLNKPDIYSKSIRGYLLRQFVWFYSWADHIVAVSQGVENALLVISKGKLKNIKVIYNPIVKEELYTKANASLIHSWFQDGEPPVILGVGRLHKQKDFFTLIHAFALVYKYFPSKLLILGEGSDREQLELLISQLGLDTKISLPGFVDNPYPYMLKAKVFVLSSRWEGFPRALTEALALGTPVISTDCPSGPNEILADGKFGYLVPVGDASALANGILKTLINPINSDTLKNRGKMFSCEATVNSYLDLITMN